MKQRKPPRKPSFVFFVLLGIIIAAVVLVWAWYSLALGATKHSTAVVIIKDGATVSQIADSLQAQHLIKSKTAFFWHAKLNGLAPKFKSGRFVLSGKDDTPTISRKLTQAPAAGRRITIKEGETEADIAQQLDDAGTAKISDFLALKPTSFDYSFLQHLPPEATLEGFLFPETYDLPEYNVSPAKAVDIFLSEFNKRVTPSLRNQMKANGHSLYNTVNIASILEREVKTDSDRRIVAGIFYKRLKENIRLDADATLRYGLHKPPSASLTASDLAKDNPYNTRRIKGLPPTPICNPGIASLEAAANPQPSDYLFYLSDPKTGKTIFAKTNDEQDANVKKYLR